MPRREAVSSYMTSSERDKANILARARGVTLSALLSELVRDTFIQTFGIGAQVKDLRGLLPEPRRRRYADGHYHRREVQ